MNRLRSSFARYVLVAWMAVSLVPLAVGPAAAAFWHRAGVSYASWLRAQLQAPATPSFEQAVDRALEARPNTLNDFLVTFVDHYEAAQADTPLADLFAAPSSLPAPALVSYLEGRLERLAPPALTPRWSLSQGGLLSPPSSERSPLVRILSTEADPLLPRLLHQASTAPALFHVLPVRVRSAAAPLGP
ncbi:MAG: hypothetical protein AAGI71_09340 [Bacteroidota bacterium]